jgi:cyclopropane-fatty-acyl-phospholipid synthase
LTAFFLERGLVPDFIIRMGIRRLLRQRLRELETVFGSQPEKALLAYIEKLKASPLAVNTKEANEQHYEVPTRFFELCLGPRLKYSSCLYENENSGLPEAEEAMLNLYCERAGLRDGQQILELGCGWGSLSLFMAEKFPGSKITGLSNSHWQRAHIMRRAGEKGLKNLEIITADINGFSTEKEFDRIVSVEMFEHLRNYELLFERIAGWLKDDGRLFVHIFTHHKFPYLFEVKDSGDWMSKYFFTGGMMPSHDLFSRFSTHLVVEKDWKVSGLHYSKTAEDWLRNMDGNRGEILKIFNEVYGAGNEKKWFEYWRVFYMACSELWKYRNGEEWGVSHYLMRKR